MVGTVGEDSIDCIGPFGVEFVGEISGDESFMFLVDRKAIEGLCGKHLLVVWEEDVKVEVKMPKELVVVGVFE